VERRSGSESRAMSRSGPPRSPAQSGQPGGWSGGQGERRAGGADGTAGGAGRRWRAGRHPGGQGGRRGPSRSRTVRKAPSSLALVCCSTTVAVVVAVARCRGVGWEVCPGSPHRCGVGRSGMVCLGQGCGWFVNGLHQWLVTRTCARARWLSLLFDGWRLVGCGPWHGVQPRGAQNVKWSSGGAPTAIQRYGGAARGREGGTPDPSRHPYLWAGPTPLPALPVPGPSPAVRWRATFCVCDSEPLPPHPAPARPVPGTRVPS
jgi:hypothetical protein